MRILMLKNPKHSRHPPREDVSWNIKCNRKRKGAIVILLVRMWVEMCQRLQHKSKPQSSSSWGCELKYCKFLRRKLWLSHPPREDVSWNMKIILLCRTGIGHPPREDVSWNGTKHQKLDMEYVILLVRMWVEIRKVAQAVTPPVCHPPREDVSWNDEKLPNCKTRDSHPPREDVSWNITGKRPERSRMRHPPREDVSWNVLDILL